MHANKRSGFNIDSGSRHANRAAGLTKGNQAVITSAGKSQSI
jgi:hypothetical protein